MLSKLEALERELVDHGLPGGLAWLNLRVPHRFTAVFLLKDQSLNLVEMVDKRHELAMRERLEVVPLSDSFCAMTMRQGRFVTANAAFDNRLDGHVAQFIMRSYIGLPLHRAPGQLIGTMCHFDFEPHDIDDTEFAFLQDAATFLSPYVETPIAGRITRLGADGVS